MQRLFNSLLGLSLVFLVVFSTGCGDDGTGGGGTGPLPPTIFLASGADLISTDATIPVGEGSFTVRVDMNDGDNPLMSLTITEDGSNIPASNLVFDGGAVTAQNPILILGADQSGTSYDIEIFPTNLVANESRVYTFTVADSEGARAMTSVTVTFAADPAVVTFGSAGSQDGDQVSTLNAPFVLEVNATAGDFLITSLAVYENGFLLPADSVIIVTGGAMTTFTSNPFLLDTPTDFIGGELLEIHPVDPTEGSRTYTIEVVDESGAIGSATTTINFVTPQVDVVNGIIWNADGPNNGGYDLDANTDGNVPRNSALAEIRDRGIDLSQPTSLNWRQSIEPRNGAILRTLQGVTLPDGFDFDNVTGIDQVIAAYDAGNTVSQSAQIQPGDLFAVRSGDKYYLIRFDNVTVTTNDNLDNYTVSVINEAD